MPAPLRSSARRQPRPPGLSDIEELLAYEQIRQLAARYALAVNMRDIDALVELFIEDVRGFGDARGRDAVRDVFEVHLDAVAVDLLFTGTHVINLVDANHATGTLYCLCQMGDEETWMHQVVVYEDTYERRDARWYFVARNHLLFHGYVDDRSPMAQEPANWPRRVVGRGSVPFDWPTWRAYRAEHGHPLPPAGHAGAAPTEER